MKRSQFFRNLAGLIAGVAVAPKLLKADPKIEANPVIKGYVFNQDKLQARIDYLKKYPLTEYEAFQKPHILIPDRISQGKHGRHTLYFDQDPGCLTGQILIDEKRRRYFIAAVNRADFPKANLMISEMEKGQLIKGRSRRRGLIPRIGKEYMVFSNAMSES
jgi:hypothetical protein